MSRQQWSGDEHALFNALQQLLEGQFAELPADTLKEVFAAVLQEHDSGGERQDADAASDRESSGWTNRISSDVVRALDPDLIEIGDRPIEEGEVHSSIEISAREPAKVLNLLNQILDVGALIIDLQPPPALNTLVEVTIDFPDAHLTINSSGRVVHNSERGTAIEFSGLGREDRVALAAMQQELEQRQSVAGSGPVSPPEQSGATDPAAAREGGAEDSFQEPGAVPPVHNNEDPQRSFAPLGAPPSTARHRKSGRHGSQRRMVQSSTRRNVDLPDPDMNVATSTRRISKEDGKTTREFFGPPPPWFEPDGKAERVENLSGERILDILLQLSEDGFTGLLVFESEGEDREQLVFDSGFVVERSLNPRVTDEELGPMLLAADRITRRQLSMSAAHADELGIGVARSLMDLGILNPDELRHAIAGRLTFVLREFCDRTDGAVRIYDGHALPAGFLPQPPLRVHLAVERIIYERLYRRLSAQPVARREERMEEYLDTYPEVIEHQRERLDRAVSDENHRQFVEQTVTGESRMREVMTESILSPPETFAALFALHRMGLVRFDRSLHQTVVRERLRENITVKHMSVHKASYFEVLNVHWSSYSEVIEEAYQRLTEQFAPERMPDDLEDELLEKVDEINERLEAAYAALAKRKTRHAYRTRIMPEYKLEHAIPLFLKQCELAERRDNWVDARDAIRRVLEIDPDHREGHDRLERINEALEGSVADPADTFT